MITAPPTTRSGPGALSVFALPGAALGGAPPLPTLTMDALGGAVVGAGVAGALVATLGDRVGVDDGVGATVGCGVGSGVGVGDGVGGGDGVGATVGGAVGAGVAVAVWPVTTTVPLMLAPWMPQMYGNVPGVENVIVLL